MAKDSKKIAVVDINKVVAQSKQVQALKEEQTQKANELNQWLISVRADVESKSSEEEKQALVQQYNEQFAQRQNEIKADYAEKLHNIEQNMTELINQKAQEKGYDMVLSKYIVLFGGEDLTEEILTSVE